MLSQIKKINTINNNNENNNDNDKALLILWKVAFYRTTGQLQQQLLLEKQDISKCLKLIQDQIISSINNNNRLKQQSSSSLPYLSTLLLGLCRIMSCQTKHFMMKSIQICQKFDRWINKFELNAAVTADRNKSQHRLKSSSSSLVHPLQLNNMFNNNNNFYADPCLQSFNVVNDQFEQFSLMMMTTVTAKESPSPPQIGNSIVTTTINTSTTTTNNKRFKKEIIDNIMPNTFINGECEAQRFINNMLNQINSVDFMAECQDLLQQHFGSKKLNLHSQQQQENINFETQINRSQLSSSTNQKENNDPQMNLLIIHSPLSLSSVNIINSDNELKQNHVYDQIDNSDKNWIQNENILGNEQKQQKSNNNKRKTKKRKKNPTMSTGNQKLLKLKFFYSLRKTKNGYHSLLCELDDQKLNRPTRRLMGNKLNLFFQCRINSLNLMIRKKQQTIVAVNDPQYQDQLQFQFIGGSKGLYLNVL